MSIEHHNYHDLIYIFEECFFASHNTRLIRGEDEPVYIPANDSQPFHAIFFAYGYFSSGLHEISHWLVAGPERRLKEDFGYWYVPDGRNAEQQRLFEQVEVKPQAIEWILSQAAGIRFRVSTDNLNGELKDSSSFKENIYCQVKRYCCDGLPQRVAILRDALCVFYGTPLTLSVSDFELASI